MKTAEEVAEEILEHHYYGQTYWRQLKQEITLALTAYAEERVKEAHHELAVKQVLIHGESVTLGGKVVTNEELYKQPVDYIREARAEALEEVENVVERHLPHITQQGAIIDCQCKEGILFSIRALKESK